MIYFHATFSLLNIYIQYGRPLAQRLTKLNIWRLKKVIRFQKEAFS